MTAAALLIAALALSMSSRINVGRLALAFAWLVARAVKSDGDKMVGK